MSEQLITVGLNSQPIAAVFGQIIRRSGGGTRGLMRDVAGIMLSEVEDNFAAQGRPRWLELKSVNLARAGYSKSKAGKWAFRKRNSKPGYMILQDTGRLASSITQAFSADSASVGTNLVYAAIHQFGGRTKAHLIRAKNARALATPYGPRKSVQHPGSVIPARPFLTISQAGEGKILRVGEAFLAGVIGA